MENIFELQQEIKAALVAEHNALSYLTNLEALEITGQRSIEEVEEARVVHNLARLHVGDLRHELRMDY